MQQLQLETRQLQQTLIVKQDELTQLNRDNARLLTEARQLHKDQQAQQRLLDQKALALEALQSQLSAIEAIKLVLEQRNQDLQGELDRLSKSKARQGTRRQPRNAERATVAVDKSAPPAKSKAGRDD